MSAKYIGKTAGISLGIALSYRCSSEMKMLLLLLMMMMMMMIRMDDDKATRYDKATVHLRDSVSDAYIATE